MSFIIIIILKNQNLRPKTGFVGQLAFLRGTFKRFMYTVMILWFGNNEKQGKYSTSDLNPVFAAKQCLDIPHEISPNDTFVW